MLKNNYLLGKIYYIPTLSIGIIIVVFFTKVRIIKSMAALPIMNRLNLEHLYIIYICRINHI